MGTLDSLHNPKGLFFKKHADGMCSLSVGDLRIRWPRCRTGRLFGKGRKPTAEQAPERLCSQSASDLSPSCLPLTLAWIPSL